MKTQEQLEQRISELENDVKHMIETLNSKPIRLSKAQPLFASIIAKRREISILKEVLEIA